MRRPTRLALSLTALGLAALATFAAPARALHAQKRERPPKRPPLEAGADTNDWRAYYFAGLSWLDRMPDRSAAAFSWAARLNPDAAEPLYGLWAALWSRDLERFEKYLTGVKYVVESRETQRQDSLLQRALLRNPFLQRTLERRLIERVIQEETGQVPLWTSADAEFVGWLAYTRGDMRKAIAKYGEAVARDSNNASARLYRARAFYFAGMPDSAITELTRVVQTMRRREEKQVVYWYESKAQLLYGIGVLQLMRGDLAAARTAYGEALTEDLTFGRAHEGLARIALVQGDTATALAEYDLAVQGNAQDGALRVNYGGLLLSVRRGAEAETQLRQAVALEPDYAAGYINLALALDLQGKLQESVAMYQAFVPRAPREMARQVAFARERIATFATTGGTPR